MLFFKCHGCSFQKVGYLDHLVSQSETMIQQGNSFIKNPSHHYPETSDAQNSGYNPQREQFTTSASPNSTDISPGSLGSFTTSASQNCESASLESFTTSASQNFVSGSLGSFPTSPNCVPVPLESFTTSQNCVPVPLESFTTSQNCVPVPPESFTTSQNCVGSKSNFQPLFIDIPTIFEGISPSTLNNSLDQSPTSWPTDSPRTGGHSSFGSTPPSSPEFDSYKIPEYDSDSRSRFTVDEVDDKIVHVDEKIHRGHDEIYHVPLTYKTRRKKIPFSLSTGSSSSSSSSFESMVGSTSRWTAYPIPSLDHFKNFESFYDAYDTSNSSE